MIWIRVYAVRYVGLDFYTCLLPFVDNTWVICRLPLHSTYIDNNDLWFDPSIKKYGFTFWTNKNRTGYFNFDCFLWWVAPFVTLLHTGSFLFICIVIIYSRYRNLFSLLCRVCCYYSYPYLLFFVGFCSFYLYFDFLHSDWLH